MDKIYEQERCNCLNPQCWKRTPKDDQEDTVNSYYPSCEDQFPLLKDRLQQLLSSLPTSSKLTQRNVNKIRTKLLNILASDDDFSELQNEIPTELIEQIVDAVITEDDSADENYLLCRVVKRLNRYLLKNKKMLEVISPTSQENKMQETDQNGDEAVTVPKLNSTRKKSAYSPSRKNKFDRTNQQGTKQHEQQLDDNDSDSSTPKQKLMNKLDDLRKIKKQTGRSTNQQGKKQDEQKLDDKDSDSSTPKQKLMNKLDDLRKIKKQTGRSDQIHKDNYGDDLTCDEYDPYEAIKYI
ncbi:hypothetical protein GJ496_010649 [Pomphorhynchus laevis]|nr:hypothetical protein GJ496_010649 [Pomphorhynchus laevis]